MATFSLKLRLYETQGNKPTATAAKKETPETKTKRWKRKLHRKSAQTPIVASETDSTDATENAEDNSTATVTTSEPAAAKTTVSEKKAVQGSSNKVEKNTATKSTEQPPKEKITPQTIAPMVTEKHKISDESKKVEKTKQIVADPKVGNGSAKIAESASTTSSTSTPVSDDAKAAAAIATEKMVDAKGNVEDSGAKNADVENIDALLTQKTQSESLSKSSDPQKEISLLATGGTGNGSKNINKIFVFPDVPLLRLFCRYFFIKSR